MKGKVCQSCGMPIKYDKKGGGSEKDGSKSELYCSYCYENGEFIQKNITAEEMQNFCIEKMKEQGIPKFLGWIFTRNIPKLKRWKQ